MIIDKVAYLKVIHERQEKIKDRLFFLNNGLSIYSNNTDLDLSPGCKSCKSGTWWCLYVGYKCNLDCWYCPQGKKEVKENKIDHPNAMQHLWIDDIKIALKSVEKGTINGISYSGGEPFLYLEKIEEMASFINENFGDSIYQWIYTNGLLVTEDKIKKLKDLNIKEIRFHIGASDCNPQVIEKLKYSSKILRTTIETPSLPIIKDFLINNDGFKKIIDYGVTQLNLSELYFVQNNEIIDKYTKYIYSSMFRGTHESPIISRLITYDIIEYALENNLKIIINDCSHESRDAQILTRELNKKRLYNMW